MEATADSPHTLASLGKIVGAQFSFLFTHIGPQYERKLGNEMERYRLWASSLGLYLTGHSSLDYRFRDSPPLFQYVLGLLQDILEALRTLGSLEQDGRQDSAKVDHGRKINMDLEIDDDESEEDFSSYEIEPSSLASEYITNVSMMIDQLYSLSFRIRNPKTRTGLSRALGYSEVNPETNINVIEAYREWDLKHIRGLLHVWHKTDDMHDHFLTHRLANANTHRRQRFKYWRNRKVKMEYYCQAAINETKEIATSDYQAETDGSRPSEPSTATHLDLDDIPDTASLVSADSYAAAADSEADPLSIPPPPEVGQFAKEFECPYCFILCSRQLLGAQAWGKHVMRDLRPYVCTIEHCRDADQQYDTLTDWMAHESSEHGVSPSSHRDCPLCGKSSVSTVHIASHLRQVSLFALPLQDTEGDDDGSLGPKPSSSAAMMDSASDGRSISSASLDGWASNTKQIIMRVAPDYRDVLLEIPPGGSFGPATGARLERPLWLADGSDFRFVDANGNHVPLDYDIIEDGMVIYFDNDEPSSRPLPSAPNSVVGSLRARSMVDQLIELQQSRINFNPQANAPDAGYVLQPQNYFQPGKVFSVLWPNDLELQEDIIGNHFLWGSRPCESRYSNTRLMVVLRSYQGRCWCFTIKSYGGRGVAKPGVDPSTHAMVYIRGSWPVRGADETEMNIEPLEVVPNQDVESLHAMSRLNFGKIYTLEYNFKIKPVGQLSQESLLRFLEEARREMSRWVEHAADGPDMGNLAAQL